MACTPADIPQVAVGESETTPTAGLGQRHLMTCRSASSQTRPPTLPPLSAI